MTCHALGSTWNFNDSFKNLTTRRTFMAAEMKYRKTFSENNSEPKKRPEWSKIMIALTCSTRLKSSCSSPILKLKNSFMKWMGAKGVPCIVLLATGHSSCRDRAHSFDVSLRVRQGKSLNKQTNKLTRMFLVSFHYAKHTAVRLYRVFGSARDGDLLSSSSLSWCFNLQSKRTCSFIRTLPFS